jgi:ribosome-interacting GTPase 1
MPTNLPPDAQEAERRYRAAIDPDEKLVCLEEYISLIPKHKGTDHLRADLRRKLSKLKEASQVRKKAARQTSPYYIDQEGAGQVVVVGPTNVGKSSLLVRLTNATPEVSEAPYTTWGPAPGMMNVGNVQIQLIDTPPLNPDYVEPEMMSLMRRADMILLMVDLHSDPLHQLEQSVALLEEQRIIPAHRWERYPDSPRLSFVPLLVLVNKHDDVDAAEDYEIFCALLEEEWPCLPISTITGYNLEPMKWKVFDQLGIVRIYSKVPGREPDRTSPFVMEKGGTVEDFARKIHQDFYHNLKSARVWGSGVHDGQLVGRDHVLHDQDVVELRI